MVCFHLIKTNVEGEWGEDCIFVKKYCIFVYGLLNKRDGPTHSDSGKSASPYSLVLCRVYILFYLAIARKSVLIFWIKYKGS